MLCVVYGVSDLLRVFWDVSGECVVGGGAFWEKGKGRKESRSVRVVGEIDLGLEDGGREGEDERSDGIVETYGQIHEHEALWMKYKLRVDRDIVIAVPMNEKKTANLLEGVLRTSSHLR